MILKKVVFVLVILFQIFVSGCAYINAQRDDVNSLITKWISEQEFDKANNTLRKLNQRIPNTCN